MSQAKEEALELIRRMPDSATIEDILEQLYFREQVQRGLDDIEAGRMITHEELKLEQARWRESAGQ